MSEPDPPSPRTQTAQGGHFVDPASGAIVPPVQPSTTFARDGAYERLGGYSYGRYDNPTYDQLTGLLARLEGGAEAALFASGMAAAAALLETLERGQHVVAPAVMYHGTLSWLRRLAEKRGVGLSLFAPGDDQALAAALRPGETALVWIETPVNPTWEVIDIAAAAAAAQAASAAYSRLPLI